MIYAVLAILVVFGCIGYVWSQVPRASRWAVVLVSLILAITVPVSTHFFQSTGMYVNNITAHLIFGEEPLTVISYHQSDLKYVNMWVIKDGEQFPKFIIMDWERRLINDLNRAAGENQDSSGQAKQKPKITFGPKTFKVQKPTKQSFPSKIQPSPSRKPL